MIFEFSVELRNDGFVISGYCHDSELQAFSCGDGTELGHVHANELRLFLQLEDHDLELASGELQRVCRRRPLEEVGDLSCRNLLRVEKQVYAHLCEEVLVFV